MNGVFFNPFSNPGFPYPHFGNYQLLLCIRLVYIDYKRGVFWVFKENANVKRIWSMIAIVLVLQLAACSSSQPGSSGSVPGTGPTATVPVLASSTPTPDNASGGTTGGIAAAPTECAGVDFQALAATGQQYYEANCASCHGAQGAGTEKNPALAGNTVVNTQDPAELVTRFFTVPAHAQTITTDEAAAVFTYIRGAFGNTGQPICSFQVLENRPAQ
jgi:mono/diheme cytochrome c family protein